MSNYSKYNVIYRLQKWMDSVPGQTFLNYGYSWGASIVILGALFKLTHLPGANFWLFFGIRLSCGLGRNTQASGRRKQDCHYQRVRARLDTPLGTNCRNPARGRNRAGS